MRSRIWLPLCLSALLIGCGAPKPPTNSPPVNTPHPPTPSVDATDNTHDDNVPVGEISQSPKSETATISEPTTEGKSVGELIEQLGSPKTRDAASAAIVAKGPSAVSSLSDALTHENWQIRAGAVFTLGQLGKDAESVLPALKSLAQNDGEEAVRDAAQFAIDAIENRQP
jgi:hypothetical protein